MKRRTGSGSWHAARGPGALGSDRDDLRVRPGSDVLAAQPRALIVTIYGLYARDTGGWLSIAAVIKLMAELGVDEPAVRSAISRLKLRGLLESRREGGAAGYGLSGRRRRDPGRGRPADLPATACRAPRRLGARRVQRAGARAGPAARAAVPAGLARFRYCRRRCLDRAGASWPRRRARTWRPTACPATSACSRLATWPSASSGQDRPVVGPGPA